MIVIIIYSTKEKITELYKKVIKTISLSDEYNSNAFLFRSLFLTFSGFLIIFIGYLLINNLNNFPLKEIGITP